MPLLGIYNYFITILFYKLKAIKVVTVTQVTNSYIIFSIVSKHTEQIKISTLYCICILYIFYKIFTLYNKQFNTDLN